ncbi:MAG: hypothetical protein H7066_04590 [Cytophagaceae bacterium]|nr:hypothetical protein [Gemmatimonadaceae bacterium]
MAPTRQSPPSSRVQLEVAFLDAHQSAIAPSSPAPFDEHARLTVLVVAAESDVRRYVRECLRERTDLRVLEAATIPTAVLLAAHPVPVFLVVDEAEREVVATLSQLRAIVIVDDVPHSAPAPGARVRLLARPFSAEGLVAEVGRLLG